MSIEIPVRDSSEVVEVFLDELPADADEIASVLVEERAPLDLFLQFAIEYYNRKQKENFERILEGGIGECKRRGIKDGSYVSLLATSAAHRIFRGLEEGERRERYFNEAAAILNEAERRDQMAEEVWIRKGQLMLARRNLEGARAQFAQVAEKSPVAGRLGLGLVSFIGGNYSEAVDHFQTVLREMPSGSATLRLILGHALYRTEREKQARRAFERVLELQPQLVEGLVALAVLLMNRAGREDGALGRAMQLFKKAYDLDRDNPTVCIHLANHFFFRKEYSKATLLLEKLRTLTAEASFVKGKIAHVLGNYDQAFLEYSEAVRLDPAMAVAQYGLGQMFIRRGDISAAIDCFERVHSDPAVLGMLYAAVGQTEKAESHLRRALKQQQQPANLYEALALIGDEEAWEHAAAMPPPSSQPNAEFLANLAASRIVLGNLSGAEEILALLSSPDPELDNIIRYNRARLLEEQGGLAKAEREYKDILSSQPSFIECHLRLGLMAAKSGQMGEAMDHYKDAIGVDSEQTDAWTLLACTQLRIKALTPARKAFERVLALQKNNIYALIALGNILAELGRSSKNTDYLSRAGDLYAKALSLQPSNAHAANGLGVILAERGQYHHAKQVFQLVRQAAPLLHDAALNLGHCFVELGQFSASVHSYDSVLSRVERKAPVHLFLARALYLQGKAEKDLAAFEQAVDHIKRAQLLLPSDQPIRYNQALVQQEWASTVLKIQAPSEHDLSRALNVLELAESIFLSLLEDQQTCCDRAIIQQRHKYCQSLSRSLQSRLAELAADLERRSSRLAQVRHQRQLQELEEQQRQAQEHEKWLQEQTRIERVRQEMAAKLKDDSSEIAVKKKREKTRSASSTQGSSVEQDRDEDEEIHKRQKTAPLSKALASSPSDSDGNNNGQDDDQNSKSPDNYDQIFNELLVEQ